MINKDGVLIVSQIVQLFAMLFYQIIACDFVQKVNLQKVEKNL